MTTNSFWAQSQTRPPDHGRSGGILIYKFLLINIKFTRARTRNAYTRTLYINLMRIL